jgi:hypothetical protein
MYKLVSESPDTFSQHVFGQTKIWVHRHNLRPPPNNIFVSRITYIHTDSVHVKLDENSRFHIAATLVNC